MPAGAMDRVIWKYTEQVEGEIVLTLPEGAELLHVADQIGDGRQLDFWALVPRYQSVERASTRERVLRVLGTGHGPIRPRDLLGLAHWQTVVTAGGALVWHVFLDFDGSRTIPEGS